jgi:sugar phosphate isomerase/epimerase
MRIAVATRCLHVPLRESIRQAAGSGARALQFDVRSELTPDSLTETGRRQFLHQLSEQGLRVGSLTYPTRRSFYDEDRLEARVAATRRAMQFARQLQSSVLTVRIGPIPADAKSKTAAILRDVLSDLARFGNHVGVTLSISPSGNSPQALLDLIEEVKTGPLGIDFDPVAFLGSGHNPVAAFRTIYTAVTHLQARDAFRDAEGQAVEVPLGRGEVDWIELLPLLGEISYSGWVTVLRTSGEDPAGVVLRGVKFLQQVFTG